MKSSGWKVAALLLAMTTIAGAFGTVANRNALRETERQLADATNYKPPGIVTVDRVVHAPCPNSAASSLSGSTNNQCRGGVVLKKTLNGWESVLHNGRPLRCQ